MKTVENNFTSRAARQFPQSILAILLAVILFCSSAIALPQPQALAYLAQGDAITDPQAILRYSLPIDNDEIRKVQEDIEDIAYQLRGKRWGKIERDVKNASFVLKTKRNKILAAVPEERQSQAEALLEQINTEIEGLKEVVDNQDKEAVYLKKDELLKSIGKLERSMVVGFPFEVPEKYADLPQLLGRATVEMETSRGTLEIIIDGYSAPINGGNFVDLVDRGFYDGMEFTRAEDFYILQAGDPPGEDEGFIDPDTGEYRAIPLEVLVEGDSEPVYGETLENLGRYLDKPAIPFNAYGAIALARPANDPNGGSSQFFFFKFDRELTPPGYNLMDGRYSVFGYVVEGQEILDKLGAGDEIVSAKVIEGKENLVEPS
ncbi:peptidylprolyl isomerase [Myxosarcina sp. GI1]|uniref:peptidylprolyl isomerase n=1 Tax=Myxosarcina sp. GI1 TaxID=1541065 RepID=UPI0005627503|nr:peptidylprolyl isomerase [Myxosarcina sp. GI1]